MEFFTTLKDTPLPTLLVIGGLIFLFLGIATIKKPIVIDVTPSNRKIALVLGIVFVGIGLYLILSQPASPASIATETPTANIIETPTLIDVIETSASTDTATPQEIKGYMLFFDDKRVGYEPNWTCQQAMENLLWNTKQYPNKKVEGWFGEKKIEVAGMGYELFFDCKRVGYEPQSTSQQAIENLLWNIKQYPDKKVEGLFNGEQLIP